MKKIMILGTFHMGNHNRDLVNGKYEIDETNILKLLDKLSKFAPTKIALESKSSYSKSLNQELIEYIDDNFILTDNEVHQIAFRLSKKLGLNQLYCVDWNERIPNTLDMGEVFEKIKESNKVDLVDEFYLDANRITQNVENLVRDASLIEAFKYINSDEGIDEYSWLNLRLVKFNLPNKFIGNQWLTGWYTRNLNITSNILDIVEKNDRILVLYGASHIKILKEMLGQCPDIEIVNPLEYLEKANG